MKRKKAKLQNADGTNSDRSLPVITDDAGHTEAP